jgi:hypothetical protein
MSFYFVDFMNYTFPSSLYFSMFLFPIPASENTFYFVVTKV